MAIKLGLIGTGSIVKGAHLPRIQTLKGVKIAGQCDISAEAVKESVEKYGGNPYTDYREMLAKEKLDGVLIAVRPTDHGDIEFECAKRKLPMFIEKPVSLDMNQAKSIDRAINRSKTFASVGYVFRYIDLMAKWRKLLAGRKVALVLVRYHGPLIPREWWYNRSLSGGQTTEQVTHCFDLARDLIGEIKEIDAAGYYGIHKSVKNYDIDDATLVNLRFENGALGSFAYSCVRKAGWTVEMEIVAEDLRTVWSFTGRTLMVQNGDTEVIEQKNDPYLDELKVFFDAIKKGDPSKIRSPYSDAVKTLGVTTEINKILMSKLKRKK